MKTFEVKGSLNPTVSCMFSGVIGCFRDCSRCFVSRGVEWIYIDQEVMKDSAGKEGGDCG